MTDSPHGRRPGHIPLVIACITWIFGHLVLILPRTFRREYGRLIVQDFARGCCDVYVQTGMRGVIWIGISSTRDLFGGAIVEHLALFGHWWKGAFRMQRIRISLITIFCAYIAFVIAGIGLQKMTEYDDFHSVAQHQLTVGIPFAILYYGSAFSLLAVLIGGVPLALAVLRQALTERRWLIVGLFAVPPVALAVFAGFAVLFVQSYGRTVPSGAGPVHILLVAFLIAATLSTFAVSYAIARTDVSTNLYRFATWPALVTAFSMIVMCAATIIVALRLNAVAPQILGDMVSYQIFSLLNVTILMAIATLIAAFGAVRLLGRRRSSTSLA